MTMVLGADLLSRIHQHGEQAYPEEGVGFLLGSNGQDRVVHEILGLPNAREKDARSTRYLITARDYLNAEIAAQKLTLDIIGVFHSHPDHPNRPSEFDREWAQPNFSYLITSVELGQAIGSRSWRLKEDRSGFIEEGMRIDHPS